MVFVHILLLVIAESSTCRSRLVSEGQSLIDLIFDPFSMSQLQQDTLNQIQHSGKTINDLGHWHSCTNLKDSHYLIVDFKLSMVQTKVGICVPVQCTPEDLTEFIGNVSMYLPHYLKSATLNTFTRIYKPLNTKCGTGCYLSWLAIFCLVTAVAFGSYFGSKQKSERIDEDQNLTRMQELLACFSIYDNFSSLFYRKFQDSTSIFDGIRALSLLWIISVHVEIARFLDVIVDLNDISEFLKTFLASFIPQATYSVDAFFWLSGFLLGFLILDEANKRGGKIRWGGVFVTRIIRLLPMYMFILIFINFIIPSWATGPKWDQVETYIKTDCDKYWWTNLLFVNNHIPWYTGNDCVGQSWYMAADIQMLILSMPIISLYVYSHKSGWIAIITLLITSVTYRLIVSSHYHIYMTILNKFSDTDNFRKIHTSTISNLSPYLIGIICGFVLNHSKKTKSSDTIILKIDSFFANKTKSFISFTLGFGIFIALVCIPYRAWSDVEGGYMGYPIWFQVIFVGFQNFNASLAFCLMFLPLLYEMIPWVGKFLALKIWIPLARASFSIYIIHIAIIRVFIAAERNASEFTEYRILTDYALFAPVSVVTGMALYVIIENPIAKALKILMTSRRAVGVKSLITELKSIP